MRYAMPLQAFSLKASYDVIIVGTGIAGLCTALSLSDTFKVALLTKQAVTENNSYLAQGGIAASLEEEDQKHHLKDTLVAGCHFNVEETTQIMVRSGAKVIGQLQEWDVQFDKDAMGNLLFTKEGGHSFRRILHVKDQTGKAIIDALYETVQKKSHITLMTDTTMVDLVTSHDQVMGVSVVKSGQKNLLIAPVVVMATGGIGHIFGHTTNAMGATGDGLAAAVRAGVPLKDMEFVQFHPTAFYHEGAKQRFLISEAMRGEGGILRDPEGRAFMEGLHPLKDLAPRDIVARAILKVIRDQEISCVYLDVTHLGQAYLASRFPTIYQTCLEAGLDIAREWIPVRPVEHYMMGGIQTDADAKTSVVGFYAVGEVACTGVHGANRIASNSLLEGAVFGIRAAEDINKKLWKIPTFEMSQANEDTKAFGFDETSLLLTVQKTLEKDLFIFRKQEGMLRAQKDLANQLKPFDHHHVTSLKALQAYNALLCAHEIAKAAVKRDVSLGSHQIVKE